MALVQRDPTEIWENHCKTANKKISMTVLSTARSVRMCLLIKNNQIPDTWLAKYM